jgi:hypothetical protein
VSVVLFPDWNYKELSGDFTMAWWNNLFQKAFRRTL